MFAWVQHTQAVSLYKTTLKAQVLLEWRDVNRLTSALYQKLSKSLNRTFCNVAISASQVYRLSSGTAGQHIVHFPAPSLEGMLVNVLSARYPRHLKASAFCRWRGYQQRCARNRASAAEILWRLGRKQTFDCVQGAFRCLAPMIRFWYGLHLDFRRRAAATEL